MKKGTVARRRGDFRSQCEERSLLLKPSICVSHLAGATAVEMANGAHKKVALSAPAARYTVHPSPRNIFFLFFGSFFLFFLLFLLTEQVASSVELSSAFQCVSFSSEKHLFIHLSQGRKFLRSFSFSFSLPLHHESHLAMDSVCIAMVE